eukprot:CAMPEP_0206243402 /NCGR_PEP_ID=MMETSP0047_2-20121206/17588_1 /ASSEMBLY_ACC=CAM_ASM_000192 /TAXON_ID=195065 /ORGANISM="Chroomonas mesostigmatica_cf, Strain CCMP1168" /LENGTH=167 /DNA_ID=CAMNT_0053668519 /DNA_START=36 /DNA_END=539 /DNA_ORIENTATION=+
MPAQEGADQFGARSAAITDLPTKMVHTSVLSGVVGFVLGSTKGMLNEPRLATSAPSFRTVTPQSWQFAAQESAMFAAVGAVFVGGTALAETVRGKDDMVNKMWGACGAGVLVGARKGSALTAAAACPTLAALVAIVEATDGRFRPPAEWYYSKHPELVAPFPKKDAH